MTMFNMGKYRILQISLIGVIISLTASSRSENPPRITNLNCLNDYRTNMFCSWDVVDSYSNCRDEFSLFYTDYTKIKQKCHDLQNSTEPNRCVCHITADAFAPLETYDIEVESHGNPVEYKTIEVISTIKPSPPVNVRVEFQEDQDGAVKWDSGYSSSSPQLSFHVEILCKQNRRVELQSRGQQGSIYGFTKKQLKRGENYVARVRTKPVHEGAWSEWSAEAEWTNDYSLAILDLINVIIPTTCLVMLFLIIAGYFCLSRFKKEWWDTIPNPAKSTIIKNKLEQKHQLMSDTGGATKKSCGGFFSRIVKAHKSKCDQFIHHDNIRSYVIGIVSSDPKKFTFEPRKEDIERCLEMHPRWENEINSVQEDQLENKTEECHLEVDLSIANMFLEILQDSSNGMDHIFENGKRGSFGYPALMDNFGKEDDEQSNSNVSGHQKLDDSPSDISSNIDMSCFDQWPNTEIDSMSYNPRVSITENCLSQTKGGLITNSGYNSFADAVSEARKEFISDATKTFFLESGLKNRSNIYEQQLCPKSILYYNTKCFCSHINEDIFHSKMSPETGHESGYQSFDQAVQEELGCHESGYKGFDQAVQQGNEISVSEIAGYRSFDQAVQENGPELGYDTSGYKSYDQTVQEGADTFVPQFNGYQSFDQAVQADETSGLKNCSTFDSGYKPFESLLGQNNDKNREYKFLSSGLMELTYWDSTKAAKECPATSDKPLSVSKTEQDANLSNATALNHGSIPLALTFDICEHLKNLGTIHGHKVPINCLETGTIPINQALFLCHLDRASFTQQKLNKNLNPLKCPPTANDFENLSFCMPLYYLDMLDTSQATDRLIIQQSSFDKDGNSYMKIK